MTDPTPVRQLPRCELCDGPQIGNLGLVSQHPVGVHPNGRVLWEQPLSALHAVLCLQCGHTKLFAAQLAKVQAEAEKHPERFTW